MSRGQLMTAANLCRVAVQYTYKIYEVVYFVHIKQFGRHKFKCYMDIFTQAICKYFNKIFNYFI